MKELGALARSTVRDFTQNWRKLFTTDLMYKMMTIILLGPLVSVALRLCLWLSGNQFLSDQDIALFFLTPIGFIALVLTCALQAAISMIGMATLLSVFRRSSNDGDFTTSNLLLSAFSQAPLIVSLTVRMIVWLLAIAAPFIAILFALYVFMLGEHDINFYLHQRPPEFKWAVVVASALLLILAVVAGLLLLSWFIALPIAFFERTSSSESLAASRRRTAGHRWKILICLIVWFLVVSATSVLVTAFTVSAIQMIIPQQSESIGLLASIVGAGLLFWFIVHLMVGVFGATSFAALYLNIYRICGGNEHVSQPDDVILTSPIVARLSGRRLGLLLVIATLLSVAFGAAMVSNVVSPDQVSIIAHRGASASAPENTTAAIELAIQCGADWVEIDVQENADGEVVVFHDSDFMKLSDNPLKIWEATSADLASIDIGSSFSPEFSDQRVPTLLQVLQQCKDRAGVFIELKYYGHDQNLEQKVVEIVESVSMSDDIVIMSLKRDAVTKTKSLRPNWQVGLLLSVSTGDLNKIDADFVAVNAAFANRNFVKAAKNRGKSVYVWTVNDAISMSTLISRGVDGLITDQPEMARDVVQQRNDMSIAERLLVDLAGRLGLQQEILTEQ